MTPIVYKEWEQSLLRHGGISWETGQPLPTTKFVFSTPEHIDNLFRKILENQDYENEFVLVSAASDSSLMLQSEVNPITDIVNWVLMDPILTSHIEYHDYICRARVEKTRCLKSDKYCFKMYSWLAATFPCIPKQVKRWYCTNCNIADERVVPIPFGIHPDAIKGISEWLDYPISWNYQRSNKVVASWTSTTNERARLLNSLGEGFLKDKCSQSEYFTRLVENKYCLCPEGNGPDSYRILESIYLGCTPLIVTLKENPNWLRAYPIVNSCTFNRVQDALLRTPTFTFTPHYDMDFWEKEIYENDR